MTRNFLPQRRRQDTFEVRHEGHVYTVSVGFHADGRPGEVFIHSHKSASALEAVARDAAILVSLAMQHDVGVEQLRQAVTRDGRGAPATIVGAVLDAVSSISVRA